MKSLKALLIFFTIISANPTLSREWWEVNPGSQPAPAPKQVTNKNDGKNRIGRLANLFDDKQVDRSYIGLGNPAYCTNTNKEYTVYCVTSDRGIYPKNALLTINLKQNLMFVVRGLDDSSACTKRPLDIVAFYGDSMIADNRLIPLNAFATAFNTYVQEYGIVMGCVSGYNPGWKFNASPFGFNMKFPMPWQKTQSAGFYKQTPDSIPNDQSWK